jgi:hypothetical protein
MSGGGHGVALSRSGGVLSRGISRRRCRSSSATIALFEDVECAGRNLYVAEDGGAELSGRRGAPLRAFRGGGAHLRGMRGPVARRRGCCAEAVSFTATPRTPPTTEETRALMAPICQSARGVFEDCLWWRGNRVCFSLTAPPRGEEGDEEDALAFLPTRRMPSVFPLRKRQWLALQLGSRGF